MNKEQVSQGSHWLHGNFVFIALVAIFGLLFLTNQLRFLPLLLLLACPLMHMFMNHGRREHHRTGREHH